MAVVKIIELVGSSKESTDDAARQALKSAQKKLRNIRAVDIVSTGLRGENLDEYRRDRARELGGDADQLPVLGHQPVQPIPVRDEPLLRAAPQQRGDPRVHVLDVEHRIVARLFDHAHEVEVHRRVGLARQHGEAGRVAPDLLHHLGERHEAAGALRHLHGLAGAQQAHHLDELDVERHAPLRQRVHGRGDALGRAAMVRAPNVDERVRALRLGQVIGHVDAEIGPAAVRLADRPILIVAVSRGAEQRQRHRLPLCIHLPLGRLQLAVIDQVAGAQGRLRLLRLAGGEQRRLRREHVVVDAEQRQVGADQLQHRGDGALAEHGQPLGLRRGGVAVAELRRERRADRDQIVAGIKAVGDGADRLAQRLAVAQVGGAGERVDLRARVVDIVLPHHPMARELQQAGERVADHCAAAMTHVHRPGRVGGDIFDVDRRARARVGAAIFAALLVNQPQLVRPNTLVQPQI